MAEIHNLSRQTIRFGGAVKPCYDLYQSYAQNFANGPQFAGEFPKRVDFLQPIDFLGVKINSPIGVPAGPLLNAEWVSFAARLGFDVPVYKTIRSAAYPGHSLPNIVYVEREGSRARAVDRPSSAVSITNSFGMPSMSPDFLMQDIEKANRSLGEGQVMIVSVVGGALADFVQTAQFAKGAGAKLIEANFSCPNVGKEGCLYFDEGVVYTFTKAIVAAIHPIPLILKVGAFHNVEQMRGAFVAAARGGAQAICGLNSVSMEVVDQKGAPALGENRKTSGVCGDAIRSDALQFMKDAVQINQRESLGLTLMGCGGLMRPEHLQEMLNLGAHLAMSATGMMWDPLLAHKFHNMRTLCTR